MSASLSRSAAGLGMASERTRLRMVTRLREQGIRDEVVLAAMAQVPRHLFVEEAFASRACEDTALPIGFGQTISQPYVVARSCELARSGRALDMVLEIGGGCGYQAAVLGRLAREVYTIERIGALAAKARQTPSAAGVNNVKVRNADGREASLERRTVRCHRGGGRRGVDSAESAGAVGRWRASGDPARFARSSEADAGHPQR